MAAQKTPPLDLMSYVRVSRKEIKMSDLNIIEAIDDENLFRPFFKNPSTWKAWMSFLCALFGLPMEDYEARKIFKECTKRKTLPSRQVSEAWMVVGRRGGKSFISALVAVYLACFGDYSKYLQVGESGVIMLICPDRRQARVLMRYISALMNNVALLKPLIVKETLESIELNNRVIIEVHTASFRTIRGYSVIAAIIDEIAFLRSEDAANPDEEILSAVRPAMVSIPDSLLLCLSSPYAKRGALYDSYKRYFGREREILVWQASTRTMNPSVSEKIIEQAMQRDPESARAEYLAQFRSDIQAYVSREAIEQCTILGRIELPPIPGVRYSAFVDPSGGSSDSFTLAISHEENRRKILDCIREVRPPFNPDKVVKDYAELLRSYWLREVTGDRYGGIWPESKFREYGIAYKISEKNKSDLYRDFLPLVNGQQIELLDNKRLSSQLTSLERRTGRGGRDTIDHPFGLHDDVCNAVAGVLVGTAPLKIAGTW